jgi:hypothetical protein
MGRHDLWGQCFGHKQWEGSEDPEPCLLPTEGVFSAIPQKFIVLQVLVTLPCNPQHP